MTRGPGPNMNDDFEPPWIVYPRPYAAARPRWAGFGSEPAQAWLCATFLPFWTGLSSEQRGAYLRRWPAPDPAWPHYLLVGWLATAGADARSAWGAWPSRYPQRWFDVLWGRIARFRFYRSARPVVTPALPNEPKPPWVVYPDPQPSPSGPVTRPKASQYPDAFLHLVFLPRWRSLSYAQREAYLERWPPPHAHWLSFLRAGFVQVPPPWIEYAGEYAGEHPSWGGYRQGCGEGWLHFVFMPFWRALTIAERADYLRRWPPPDEDWNPWLRRALR